MVLLHTCKHISSLHSKLLSTLSIMYYHAIELIMKLRIMIYAAVQPRSAARVLYCDTTLPYTQFLAHDKRVHARPNCVQQADRTINDTRTMIILAAGWRRGIT